MSGRAEAVTSSGRGASAAVETTLDLHRLAGEWHDLDRRSLNLFGTYDWVSCWLHHRAPASVRATTCRQDGRLVAVLPLVSTRARGLRTVRVAGHDVSDEAGVACAAEARPLLPELTRKALAAAPPWDLFVGDHLPVEERWAAALGGTRLRGESSWLVDLRGRSWEDYLGALSRNHRQAVRRRERGLAREHQVRIRTTSAPERVQDDMTTLFRLHEARFGVTDFSGRHGDFHRAFAAVALERGWLRLRVLELDGRPAAAWYGFAFGGSAWFYQSGRDRAAAPLGVGTVLTAYALRSAMQEGLGTYRFLRGDEAYKRRWADNDRPVETVALAGRAWAGLVLAAGGRAARWPPARRLGGRMLA